jgi:hypothetical protein
MATGQSLRAPRYHRVQPYFQQYGPCDGKEESTQEKSTSGRPDSTLAVPSKPRASTTGRHIRQSIRFIMVHTLLQGWHSRQIDYVQVYPQADIEVGLYKQISKGFEEVGCLSRHVHWIQEPTCLLCTWHRTSPKSTLSVLRQASPLEKSTIIPCQYNLISYDESEEKKQNPEINQPFAK